MRGKVKAIDTTKAREMMRVRDDSGERDKGERDNDGERYN